MPTPTFKITAIESQLYEWDKPPIWNGMHVYDKGRLHLVKVTAFEQYREWYLIGSQMLKDDVLLTRRHRQKIQNQLNQQMGDMIL
ncbi:hypothetical protein F4Y59_11150 [Candidatus Poribacteria bacterium]|nr:hypothetical protein [Candidatus Poribacteria bacterium]MXY28705.1 hypothetical protein [Candidatus Poribacteria bacterium]MYK17572.1 hypothetical protein [Candidatus Poribacteria bacterium]